MNKIIEINEEGIKNQLGELVRGTVEETLNALLDTEAEALCGAKRHERSELRKAYLSGHYNRKLETKTGPVNLQMPKLRYGRFETAIIERYKRRECSVEEALVEMYVAGVSVRRIEDMTEMLWGSRVSASTISNLNQKVYVKIEEWRNRPIVGEYPYVYLDGIFLKRSWGSEVYSVSVLVAIGVNSEGHRDVLGVMEGLRENKENWKAFLTHLKERGLRGVRLCITDKSQAFIEAVQEVFPDSDWQRCMVHFYRNVMSKTPTKHVKEVIAMVKAIHAQENMTTAKEKANKVVERLKEMKLKEAANTVEK
jgi:putative transposase